MRIQFNIAVIYFYWFYHLFSLNPLSLPDFYQQGESTTPTQQILRNLTHFRNKWISIKKELGFDETYSMTFSWDCTICDDCYKANQFIIIKNDNIIQLQASLLNDDNKKEACKHVNITRSNQINQYKTIDQLYNILINWVQNGTMFKHHNYIIMQLVINPIFYYPQNIKLTNSKSYIGWDIVCFEAGNIANEGAVCDYNPSELLTKHKSTFWLSQETQTVLGWGCIFLILVACSLGYCINWLKKKKTQKIEAWREKEEQQRKAREQARLDKKAERKRERKGSKAKPKPKHRHKKKYRHKNAGYSGIPIIHNNHQPSDSIESDISDMLDQKQDTPDPH